jgi:hypothetical protein
MKHRDWSAWVTMFVLFFASLEAVAQQQTTYRLTLICKIVPTNPGVGCSVADINNKGELVGSRHQTGGPPQVAYIWRQGEFIELNSLLMNSDFAFAQAINDHSDVVGQFEDAQVRRWAFLWQRGKVSLIEIAPDHFAWNAWDINKRREVLLSAPDGHLPGGSFVWRARDGHLTRLDPLPGMEGAIGAVQLNNRGAVAGHGPAEPPAFVIPLLWEGGTVMQIQLPQGAVWGNTWAMNDRGVVVGVAVFPERAAGYRWQDGQATELPSISPPALLANTPLDINNRGVIVGFSPVAGTESDVTATLWPRRGDPVDLNTLIADDDPLKPFVRLVSANLINDRGEIVASGRDSRDLPFGGGHWLLTPQR